jgi:hypothetical protein
MLIRSRVYGIKELQTLDVQKVINHIHIIDHDRE